MSDTGFVEAYAPGCVSDYAPDSYECASAAAPVDRVQRGHAAALLRFERSAMSATQTETTDGHVPGRPRPSDYASGGENGAYARRTTVPDRHTMQSYHREMMCVTDADFVDDRRARSADVVDGYAPGRKPVTTDRKVSFGRDVTPDYEQRWQMSNRLARSLDGGPRRGRSPDHTAPREMADTLALPLRRVLVYVDPQTDLSSPQRRECRMTLNSYEKVIDAQTTATKVKRTNRAAKRLNFFGKKKPNTADGTFTESRPTVCVDQNMSDNDEDENAGCTAVLCKEEPPYVKPASSPTRTPQRASRDGTDNSGRSTTARRVLSDDTNELERSTAGRRHHRDVTSSTPKRASVNTCECVQRVCNKEQYKHVCDKCDKKTDTDYAPVSRRGNFRAPSSSQLSQFFIGFG